MTFRLKQIMRLCKIFATMALRRWVFPLPPLANRFKWEERRRVMLSLFKKQWFFYFEVSLILATLLTACAILPRMSVWEAPKRFSEKEVFSAAIQAGAQQGMQLSASDRESGTISFRKSVGKVEMILSVRVKSLGGRVQVHTTATSGGGLAIRGLHEEFIHNFHVFLFRNLGVTNASEEQVNIDIQR